jgi:hypothetical protein
MERKMDRVVYQHSAYVSQNETEASLAWESILAGHGVVAIDPHYASKKNLPSTVELLDGSGNLMYIIEAYHAIHCAVCVKSFFPSYNF